LMKITSVRTVKRIVEHTEPDGLTINIGLEEVPEEQQRYLRRRYLDSDHKSAVGGSTERSTCVCPLCAIPVPVTYRDVLILEQFMRQDGTVLPADFTGLCRKQQSIVERCVMQAHWSHLFPDRTVADFDKSGYKRFNRWWRSHWAMYELSLKTVPGSWFYVMRYNPKAGEYAASRKRPQWPPFGDDYAEASREDAGGVGVGGDAEESRSS